MYIQSYQIHNVLNVYRRQLSQGQSDPFGGADASDSQSDSVKISTKINNPSILEKVTASVLKKITSVEPGSDMNREMSQPVQPTDILHKVQKDNEFIFNTIVGSQPRQTRSIAMDSSQVLMNRLDELAKASVNRQTNKQLAKPADRWDR